MSIAEKIDDARRSRAGFALTSSQAAAVVRLADVAERVCAKMEHPTASVTIFDQTDLRAALDALKD